MSYFEEHGVDAHETHHQPENSILVPAEMAEVRLAVAFRRAGCNVC